MRYYSLVVKKKSDKFYYEIIFKKLIKIVERFDTICSKSIS